MIENKRFENNDIWIQDRSVKAKTYFLDEQQDINALCDLLNELNNENQKLKEQIEDILGIPYEEY